MHWSLTVLVLILLYGGHCFSVWLPSNVTRSFTHRVRLPASHNNAPKLIHHRCSTSLTQNFYFPHLPRLWNFLPAIDLTKPTNTIKQKLYIYMWKNFYKNSMTIIPTPSTTSAPVAAVLATQNLHYT